MHQELLEALRAVVRAETGLLRNELMDRFTMLNGQLEQIHIRVDNLHNELYDMRNEWRMWCERSRNPEPAKEEAFTEPDTLSDTNSLSLRSAALRFATKAEIHYLASKLGVHELEIDRLKRVY
ncbi:MAG: hypothetical protein K0Q59_5017 [Paenibacillus sp.]|nr:hypothetical protein [Paenibacillus sp.]